MKNSYLGTLTRLTRSWLWVSLLVAFAAPGVSFAQTFTETMGNIASQESINAAYARGAFDNDGAPNNFVYSGTAVGGTTSIGTNAPAVPVIFFGGANGNTSTAASTFQVSGINTSTVSNPTLRFSLYGDPAGNSATTFTVQYSVNGGALTSLPYADASTTGTTWTVKTASLPSGTNVTLLFTKTASATANRFRLDNVELYSAAPTINVNPAFNNFGNQVVNTASAGVAFAVQGSNLGTTPITVTAPAGFQVSTTQNGTYGTSLSLTPASGSVNTTIYTRFLPTATTAYNGNVTFVSGSASFSVLVAGQGVAPTPTLTVTPTSLPDFGSVAVGATSAVQTFTVSGNNLTAPIVVTPPAGFQIRQGTAQFSSAAISLTPTSGSVSNTAIDVRFVPTQAISYSSQVSVTSSGAASSGVAVSGTGTPAPVGPFITANPTSLDFGTISGSGSAQVLTFEVGAGNLTAPLVLTGSSNNIVFRDASAGGSFTNGPLTITPTSGSVSLRNIEVRLVGPVASGTFNGSITASSTGATSVVVSITANNSVGGSSTINATGTLTQFSTVPGVASPVQTYQIAASNLLQDVTVTAPQYFQVSLNAAFTGITSTGNTITVARNSGNDINPGVTVYVRFLPPTALTTSSLIINSSSPATSQGIPVSGTSEPTVQNLTAPTLINNIVLNTNSPSQTLNIQASRVLQPVTITSQTDANPLNTGTVSQFQLSTDNLNFSNTITLAPNASTYSISQTIYYRYTPTYLGQAQATLQFQSNDFSNTGIQSFPANNLITGKSIDTEPTQRSSASAVRDGNTAIVSFNLPANYAALGYGEGRLIVASLNATLPANQQPVDGTAYTTGNQTYGQGPQIAPGYYVVYSGPNQTVTIDGLDPSTRYYFYAFEYNNIDNNFNISVIGSENYLSPPVPTVIPGIEVPPLPVSLVSFSAKFNNGRVALNWVTAAELNNQYFEVQRSQDAREFQSIVKVAGKGTTNSRTTYNATDDRPFAGTSYYRLKQVDTDGTTTFTVPVPVTNLAGVEVTMYPNPVESILTVQLGSATEGVPATILDMTGRVIRTQTLGANGELNLSDLRRGTYMVTVGEGDTKVTRRIVKN